MVTVSHVCCQTDLAPQHRTKAPHTGQSIARLNASEAGKAPQAGSLRRFDARVYAPEFVQRITVACLNQKYSQLLNV